MNTAPWTIIGWAIVAIIVVQIVAAPFVIAWIMRGRRRAMAGLDARWRAADREVTAWTEEPRRARRASGRFKL
jgi:hypothetical protein